VIWLVRLSILICVAPLLVPIQVLGQGAQQGAMLAQHSETLAAENYRRALTLSEELLAADRSKLEPRYVSADAYFGIGELRTLAQRKACTLRGALLRWSKRRLSTNAVQLPGARFPIPPQ
jgi:hypothetical protein